jgi:Domain of unknown function (DUF4159)/Aerotolerance regulator N-terminal
MMSNLSFITPLALWGLLALPVIWWLLRFIPPRPQSIKFPPLRILLSLQSKEETPDKTPWWLLLLRLTLAAIMIFAVAHPLLNKNPVQSQSTGPLLLVVDDGWAAAKSWPKRQEALRNILENARDQSRTVIVATTSPTAQAISLTSITPSDALNKTRALQPQALPTDRLALLTQLKKQNIKTNSVTWLSDGIDAGSAKAFADGLKALYGPTLTALTLDNADAPLALSRPTLEGSDIVVSALRNANGANTATIQASAGNGRILAELPIQFANDNKVSTKLNLPIELRNEIQSITIVNENHAGARQLLDDRGRRKTIAIQTGVAQEAAQPLLSPLHYVTRALEPFADLHEPATPAELKFELDAGLSLLILADIGKITQESQTDIVAWLEKGGVLLRFAGPRLASASDDLLPVKLREGDRNLGSALSWETPQSIKTFASNSPFSGLTIDDRVTVTRQVLAEPDTTLTEKTWVSLSDGTPLVTAARKGKGYIILFHITANADWSNLPLSGTFVEMLQRILELAAPAGSNKGASLRSETISSYAPLLLLSGTGELISPGIAINAIPANIIDTAKASVQTPPGIYAQGKQERAINLDLKEADLASITDVPLQKVTPPKIQDYTAYLFATAALLFIMDTLAALFLSGGFARARLAPVASLFLTVLFLSNFVHIPSSFANDQSAMKEALETHLAYVKTGDDDIDQTSDKGLKGLGLILADRTSAILGDPVAINIETDDLVFYPLLYWPVTEAANAPGDAALARIDAFMKNGGTIFFDLRDNGGDFANNSGTSEALKRILAKLDIPPLEPVPENHVLTRSFYLLKEFPGRYAGGALWVETQNADTASNSDGVSGIIIGSNDFAAAWALDDKGEPINAMIPGNDRQREMAFRVGVNIVMYALTGNYKTDQVHIPALLERLGQ